MRRNRRNQPSLIRTAGRAAVISSAMTASSQATANAMHRRSQPQAQPAAVPPAAPPPEPVVEPVAGAVPPTDLVTQLTQLAQLKDAGALTEEEFQAAKTQLLNQG